MKNSQVKFFILGHELQRRTLERLTPNIDLRARHSPRLGRVPTNQTKLTPLVIEDVILEPSAVLLPLFGASAAAWPVSRSILKLGFDDI